jgi:DNA-binding transcriptional regulator YdaS (Cro superfamily)
VAYVAKQLGLSRQSIYQWTEVPADHLVDLERITGVDRSFIRPDLFKEKHDDTE